jgi:hypothetical protein
MLADYDSKPEVKMAAVVLNINMIIEELREVNTQFYNLFLQRAEEDAAIERVDSRTIRSKTDKLLNAFFNAIEFCSSEYDELDYETPANELNELISHYKTLLKARTTRSKNAKENGDDHATSE